MNIPYFSSKISPKQISLITHTAFKQNQSYVAQDQTTSNYKKHPLSHPRYKKIILFCMITLATHNACATLKFVNEKNNTIPVFPQLTRIAPESIETFMAYLSALEHIKKNVKPWLYVETLAQISVTISLHDLLQLALLYGGIEIAHGLARAYLNQQQTFDGTFPDESNFSEAIKNIIRIQHYCMTNNKRYMAQYKLTCSFYEMVISKRIQIINRKLDLSNCFLNSLLGLEFYKGTPMQQLDVSHNQLTGLPASLVGLKELNTLVAHHNNIATIADTVCALPNLTKLDISHNKLTSLPEAFGDLENLWRLDISNNNLSNLPASFADLSELHWLSLGNNAWGEVPEGVGGLENLTKLRP